MSKNLRECIWIAISQRLIGIVGSRSTRNVNAAHSKQSLQFSTAISRHPGVLEKDRQAGDGCQDTVAELTDLNRARAFLTREGVDATN